MEQIKDKELLQLFQDKKFEIIYTNYYSFVKKIAFSILKNSEDSEDIAQSVFSKLLQMKEEGFPKKHAISWLYQVVKNEAIQLLRKRRNVIEIDSVYELGIEDAQINEIMENESYQKLLAKLNKKEQEVVSLKILSGLTFREIAKVLKLPIPTVQWRYYKAVDNLRILMSNISMVLLGILTLVVKKKLIVTKEKPLKNENILTNSSQQESVQNALEKDETEDEIKNQTIQEVPVKDKTLDGVDIGILSITGIFLIFATVFGIIFVRHQQNRKIKTPK